VALHLAGNFWRQTALQILANQANRGFTRHTHSGPSLEDREIHHYARYEPKAIALWRARNQQKNKAL
jgi:hypothetical protein